MFQSAHGHIRKALVSAPVFSIAEQTTFLVQLYREQLDVVHFMGYGAPIGYLRPSVVTIHDLLPFFYPGRSMAGSFARRAYQILLRTVTRRARRVIVPARHIAQDLSEMADVPEEKIEVVPYGIDREACIRPIEDEARAKYLLQSGVQAPYFLFVGDISEHANVARFLRAISSIHELDGHSVVIAGREDPRDHEVREVLIECGLQKRVCILGPVEREVLPFLYQGAFATFSPSLYEGGSAWILESMMHGTSIVCSDIPAFREAAGAEGAIYFRPLNQDSIEEALRRIVSDVIRRDLRIQSEKARINIPSCQTS